MNRRGILRASASGLSLILSRPLPALAVALNAASIEKPIPAIPRPAIPTAVVYDERHGEARAFAAHASAHVAALYPVWGDSTSLWHGDLGSLLRRQGGVVAGLTTYSDFVIARSCGRELGLRLAFERNYRCGLDLDTSAGAVFDFLAGTTANHGPDEPSRTSQLTAWLLKPRWIPSVEQEFG